MSDTRLHRRTLMGLALATAPLAAAARASPDPAEIIDLWPGPPPGAPAVLPDEQVADRIATSGFQDRYVTHVRRPRLVVFRPTRPNGAAVLIVPGGGYIRVVLDKEGFETARQLADAGVTAFVLVYRLPGDGWADPATVALQDAQRAMTLIRANAAPYGVRPDRVAIMGFSAGGHVAASLSTARDRVARPDLSALIYPVIHMNLPHAHGGSRRALIGEDASAAAEAAASPHRHVDGTTPPTFLVHALDDASVVPANSLDYLAALQAAKVPAEAHFFQEGGHGFGIRLAQGRPAAAWPDLFLAWARRQGLFA